MRLITLAFFSTLLVAGACLAQSVGPVSRIPPQEFMNEKHFDEGQYIEASILKDVALMLCYAKNSAAAKIDVTSRGKLFNSLEYRLAVAGTNIDIKLPANLPAWEPARYDAVVAQLAMALGLQKPQAAGQWQRSVLRELESPSVETIAAISLDLSEKLKSHMLDSSFHERAALLLAAFALRERLEPFDDPRWALSRLTAHLVVAHWASGKEQGLEGSYALTAAYALMNLQTNALGRLHQLESDPQTSSAWNRALYARITGDPRALAAVNAADLTRLEWAERVYAVGRSLGKEIAVKDLSKFIKANGEKAFDSDLFFCAFRGWAPGSVGLGKAVYLPAGLKLTLTDVAVAWQASQGSVLKIRDAQELAARLNVEPGPCVHPEGQVDVIDWGGWAMQNQRRLATVYLRSVNFVRNQWGLPKDDADREQKRLDQVLGRLWLVPCLRFETRAPGTLDEAFEIFAARRQIVPMYVARSIVAAWIRTLPPGASYDPKIEAGSLAACWATCSFPNRTFLNLEGNMPYLRSQLNLPLMIQEAPYNYDLIQEYIQNAHPSPAEIQRVLRPLADYDTAAASKLADMLPPDQIEAREAAYQKLAAQDPAYYLHLITMFATTNRAKAAVYFDKARANGADPVAISYHAAEFVPYYLSIGNKPKAEEIAKEAEEVGSAVGFETMMNYCVKTHDFERGLKAAQAEEERYNYVYAVVYYIDQVKKEQPGYHTLDSLYQKKLGDLFPAGLGSYQSSTAPPARGVLIQDNARVLRRGDIVVAVNGNSVQTADQLRYLRRRYTLQTGDAVNIPMLVYRQGAYIDLKDTTSNSQVVDYVSTAAKNLSNNPAAPSAQTPLMVAQTADPARVRGLRLTGISGAPPHRLAMINGKTLAIGESAAIKLEGQTLTVRCVSITDRSAGLDVAGVNGTREVYLNDPAAN